MKIRRFTAWTLTAATAALLALASCAAGPGGVRVQTLRGADTSAADLAPAVRDALGRRPGTQQPIARTFDGQPPLIPHAVDNFDEVSLEENQCLSCHGVDTHAKRNAPRISDSHLVDREGRRLASADSRRYACQLCHVPQFDAPPLVDNAFRSSR